MAQTLKAQGLTQGPHRMCVGLRKYGIGWAVYVGYQDSEEVHDSIDLPFDLKRVLAKSKG
ncbi:hypothetical protein [Streptomyces cucumeris]|uniref:hypothetical protein n=1 Tax=Streptomyces cucumeris TaxID=2962890 RepID=UPI0020C8D5AA|nr:hypothetical protein [Streptomyces sp. NEAU-Y11]MCP9209726.1 hypothetical protein [Streptomyces sp. NEAU-Y11]